MLLWVWFEHATFWSRQGHQLICGVTVVIVGSQSQYDTYNKYIKFIITEMLNFPYNLINQEAWKYSARLAEIGYHTMTYVGLPILDRRSSRVDAAKERRPLRSSWRAVGVPLGPADRAAAVW
jgi:hypothetical protein